MDPDDKNEKLLKSIGSYFLERSKPHCFNPYDEQNVLISGEKEFEEICYSMEDSGVKDVKDSTVFEFYSKVLFLENKAKRLRSLGKSNN